MTSFITRDMTITHKEFFRILPAALKELDYNIKNNIIEIHDGDKNITIVLGNETVRHIASLSLPGTRLTISFSGYNEEETAEFLRRFDLAYRKGGG